MRRRNAGDIGLRRSSMVFAASMLTATLGPRAVHAFEWEGDLRLQMNEGGDKIGSVRYSNGENSDLKAGTYVTIAGGFAVVPLRLAEHALETGASFGFATWSTGPANTQDRLKLTRFPLHLLAYYRFDWPGSKVSLRAGGGMAYHLVPGLGGSGSLSAVDIDVDNGLGWTAEIRLAYEIVALGMGYTSMHYDVTGQDVRFDASSFGVSLAVIFPPIGAPGAATKPPAGGGAPMPPPSAPAPSM